jgi:hypothetical protein
MEIPVEMVDYGLSSSNGGNADFTRTTTSLDTGNYDGSPSYSFEVVAQNTGGSAYSVYLMDTAGSPATAATISVPSSASVPTRIRATMTTTAQNKYFIRLQQTGSAGDLKVFSARMLVNQVGATKTAVYIPLTQSAQGSTSALDGIATNAVGSTTSSTAVQITATNSLPWVKQSSRYATLTGSPFIFEAVGYTDAGPAFIDLQNCAGTPNIAAVTVGTTPTSIQSSAISTATLVDGQSYCVFAHNTSGGGTTYVLKAGLWIKVTSFSKAEIYYRIAQNLNSLAAGNWDHARALIDLSLFANPTVYFESRSHSASGSAYLMDGGTADSAGSPSAVSGGSVSWTGSTAVTRSSAVTLGTGAKRYLVNQSGSDKIGAAYVVIQTQ